MVSKTLKKQSKTKKKQFTDIGGEGSLVPPHLIEHFVFFIFFKVFECFFIVFATMSLFFFLFLNGFSIFYMKTVWGAPPHFFNF